MLSQAIDTYHSLLTPDIARESYAQLQDQANRRGLYFGTRDIVTVLRPRFLTAEQYHFLQSAIRTVMPAFRKAYRAARADENIRAQFHLNDWEETMIREAFGFVEPSPSARMDTFYLPEQGIVQLTEYNAEIPAGQAYTDVLSEVFYGLRVMGEFQKQYEVRPLPTRNQMLHALLDAYRQWGGVTRPNIAILDWREVPTYSEFVFFKQYFESQGYNAEIVDPRECEYKNGKLTGASASSGERFDINIVYKRVLISELVERGDLGLNHPVIRAVRDNAVCMVNPFACKILHKKASLAVLTDERNQRLYSADEWNAVQRFVPWTRVLEERTTVYGGETIDLMPFLAQHKDEFVVKPNDEYGGKGVVLGWTVSQSDWETILQERLQEPTIAQRKVTLPEEPFPSFVDDTVQIYDRMLDTDPYVWRGDYMSGSLCRLSTAALLNVTAGGGSTVPTFVIEKRT
ncbi:MAG: circularly permuted type 2 ATP-grasp protein [Chloroflexi bacterium]|nr:circularly permuted type 2 ATP-grasp protein [Chloroflexota bacterium]